MIMERVLLNGALFLALVWGPWWIFFSVILLAILLVYPMYEVFIYALLFDFLYSAPHTGLWSFPLWGTVISLCLLALNAAFREYIRNYA